MKKIAIALLLLATPAVAQQSLSASDRIALQIGTLAIQTQQQQDQITALQAELAKALARIKELEAPEKK